MKILDPSSANLTLPEVFQFLQSAPPRESLKRLGAYEPVSVQNYQIIKKDFELYISRSASHIPLYPPAESFTKPLLTRLKPYGLTKGEILTLIDLGVGIDRPQKLQQEQQEQEQQQNFPPQNGNGPAEIQESVENAENKPPDDEEEAADPDEQRDDYILLTAVIEEASQRFSEDELNTILAILRDEIRLLSAAPELKSINTTTNANANTNGKGREIGIPAPSPVHHASADSEEEDADDDLVAEDQMFARADDDNEIDRDE